MKLIIRYFREAIRVFAKGFAVSMTMITILTLMEIIIPWCTRDFLDIIIAQENYEVIWGGIVFFAIILLLQTFMNILRFAALDRFGGRYIEHLTLSMESVMAQTPYSEIEKLQPQMIRNILYTDVLNVFRTVGHFIPSMIGAMTVLLASIGLGFFYDLQLSVFIFIAIIVGLLLSWTSRKVLSKVAGQTNVKLKSHDAWCTQFVEMLPLVQTHNLLGYYQEKTKENLTDFISTAIKEDEKIYFWNGIVSGYHSLFSLILSAFLAIPAANGNISNLVFFTMLANLAMQQAQSLESLFQQCVRAYTSFCHIESLRQLPLRSGDATLKSINTVDFVDVSFSYTNGVAGLKNVNCHMNSGDVIQISGSNGSGKSTFIKLITGLYSTESGQILFNGQLADNYDQTMRNQQILYINQDEQLLDETFLNYLTRVSGKRLSNEEVSQFLEIFELPIDSRKIAGNGSSLSLGQRKKLLIIKMLLRQDDASVIILDEVTAGLDAKTTNLFYDQVARLAQQGNKIILLVDHNLCNKPFITQELRFTGGKCV